MEAGCVLELTFGYPLLDRVNYLLEKEGIAEGETEYTDGVLRRITVRSEQAEDLQKKLSGLSNGQVKCSLVSEGFFGF